MTGSPPPLVSISLAVWNGMHWLPACLDSVRVQTLDDFELLIIDDASTDGSAAFLHEAAAGDERIRFSASAQNRGFARTNNQAMRAARGEAVLLLNQDVVLDREFLGSAWATLRGHPDAASVQGRILRLGPDGERTDVVDSTGLCIGRDRRVVSRDQLRADAEVSRPEGQVWGADGAVALYRRSALEGARLPRRGGGWEILDEDFYMQKEDADLAWRLRRLGWSARYAPAALAWHARGGGDSGSERLADAVRANMANSLDTRVWAWRNQRLMQIKNDEPEAVVRDLPWIARRELATWLWMLLADQRRLRAIPELFRLAPSALRKRRAIAAALDRRPSAT